MYNSSTTLPNTGAALSGAALMYTGISAFALIMCGFAIIAMAQYRLRTRQH